MFPTVVWVIPSENMGSTFQVLLVISSALFDHDFHVKEAQHLYECLLTSTPFPQFYWWLNRQFPQCQISCSYATILPHAFRCHKTTLSPFCVLGLSYFLVSILLLIKSNGVINVYFTQYTSLYMYIAASNSSATSCCVQALYSLLL